MVEEFRKFLHAAREALTSETPSSGTASLTACAYVMSMYRKHALSPSPIHASAQLLSAV